ncbi:MAG TPA: hypothetical protein VJ931_16535 [Actinomycetota bacterium]|nr:hypothetical protein [Actinomycetota bacterium]
MREGQLVNLRGLGRDEVRGLMEVLSGVVPSQAQVAAVHERTEGNPLFVREVVRLLATEATLERPGRGGVPIPGSVRAVIGRRLAPLSADAVQVLSAAAVVGREFDLSLLRPACELPVERVLAGLSEAVALGVVAEEEGAVSRYRFSHSLMREVLYERLPIPARTQLHQRVGEAIERQRGSGGTGAHVAELARHFAEAAAAGEAAKALRYARLAGEWAMGVHAYEEAAAQYQRALQALTFAGPAEPDRCELLLRLGAAQARAGEYQQAKESCLQAAEIARRLGAPEQLARAALGFGERQVEGGLVNRQLVALLREALDGLGPQDAPLRARLLARLSAEFAFSDETEAMEPLSLEAVAMARRLADPAALRTAVDARWMAVWGPDGLEERTALAAEILRLAQETGDRELELEGHAHRAASSLETGDARAFQADIAAHARLTEELPMATPRWAATTMRALQALLHGSFEDAERLANEALSLEPGRPNVQFTYIDQLALLRWDQGRLGELRDQWQGVVDQFPGAEFARAWLSLADAELGHSDVARRGLRSLAEQLPQRPRDGIWLPAVALASALSVHLNEPRSAGSLQLLMAPYAGHVIAFTAPHPVVCLGSASFYLGSLATVTAQWAAAIDHFEAAIRAHERLEAGPLLARTCYGYARMLLARGQATDRSRALGLLDRALATADTFGMVAVAEGIRTLQATQAGGPMPAEPAAAEAAGSGAARNLFRREGEYWTISYEGAVVRLRDAKGLRHLARLGELRAEVEEAEGFNDPVRAARARQEMEFLVGELARAVGLAAGTDGRPPTPSGPG